MKGFEEELEKYREFQKRFTVNYKALSKTEKDILDFSKSACNIWGYIKELESRLKVLEDAKK